MHPPVHVLQAAYAVRQPATRLTAGPDAALVGCSMLV